LLELEGIKRAIIAPRSTGVKITMLFGGLAAATLSRLVIDRGENGVPFLTFYPVVLLSAIFLGGRYAAACALIAAVIANRIFMPMPWLTVSPLARVAILLLYGLTIWIIIVTGHLMRRLVLENEEHARQQDAFNLELQHRTKNALQIMRALIARGPRGEDPATYFQVLAGRLDALAGANELLRFGVLESAPLEELVARAIRPFDLDRFIVTGQPCEIARSATTPLMMALHELGTNASKYGALSAEHGSVEITWALPAAPGGDVAITWKEHGGPPVTPPTRRGLGSRLLAPNGGMRRVDLDWNPAGLRCDLAVACAPASKA